MKNIHKINQNIYITSDEYIGLSYYLDGSLVRKGVVDDKDYWEARKDYKKIILTTDQDLIKDGVQAIPDEFLEWFVKNPSCEEVTIQRWDESLPYLIFIPKEEELSKDEIDRFFVDMVCNSKEEPKQETLEEVADRLYPYEVGYGVFDRNCEIDIERERFVEGVKYQQEQDKNKYSDEEVIELLNKREDCINQTSSIFEYTTAKEWFEQFKKK